MVDFDGFGEIPGLVSELIMQLIIDHVDQLKLFFQNIFFFTFQQKYHTSTQFTTPTPHYYTNLVTTPRNRFNFINKKVKSTVLRGELYVITCGAE